MKKQRVLLIDNDPDSQVIYTIVLEQAGFDVISAGSPEEGVRTAAVERPQVIVTELFKRTRTGWKVLEALKREPVTASTPVLVVTAYAFPDDVQRAALANLVLAKPCSARMLLDAVVQLTELGSSASNEHLPPAPDAIGRSAQTAAHGLQRSKEDE